MGASAARTCVVKFLASMNPAADVLALASIEIDVSKLEPGQCMTVKWRGKPVFVRARTGASGRCALRYRHAFAALSILWRAAPGRSVRQF
eukprot:717776-Prymnesium_polylepis.1